MQGEATLIEHLDDAQRRTLTRLLAIKDQCRRELVLIDRARADWAAQDQWADEQIAALKASVDEQAHR